jgi:hypothetical protein
VRGAGIRRKRGRVPREHELAVKGRQTRITIPPSHVPRPEDSSVSGCALWLVN